MTHGQMPGGDFFKREENKSRRAPSLAKDVKNEGRSGNVYENKGMLDTKSGKDSGISAQLRRILQNPPDFLANFTFRKGGQRHFQFTNFGGL
jgi:hypothetical protein